jgi:hypothetical protein
MPPSQWTPLQLLLRELRNDLLRRVWTLRHTGADVETERVSLRVEPQRVQ